jgi:DNA sulfur modification protein DndD
LEEQVDAKISTERSSLRAIQLKIQESPDLDPVERKKLEISDALDQILRESYDEFRENMRLQVEAASSNILLQLSSEVEYQKVSISPKYQVAMLDTSHQVLPSPSSGYSQILALAFIGGLADVAGSDNFVVMDTPWGRVDRGNRKLIMKWIRERSNQTIIFVQSGELTPSEAREHFGNKMGRQLSIVRQGPNSSKIEEI